MPAESVEQRQIDCACNVFILSPHNITRFCITFGGVFGVFRVLMDDVRAG